MLRVRTLIERGDPMIGWLIIAVGIITAAAVLGWSLKGGGVRGYSVADQGAVTRAQKDIRLQQRRDERVRMRRRWLPWSR
jgi:hypothetical protein